MLSSGLRFGKALPAALAIALLAVTFLRAIVSLDLSWDAIAYHTPFIALRMGFISPEQFQMRSGVAFYFDGFPPLLDYIRGVLWWATGRMQSANLLAPLSLLAVIVYAKARYTVPLSWCVIGLFAIPAVQTTASVNYTDLTANCFLLIVILSVCEAWADGARFTSRSWWAVLAAAAFMAINSKLHIAVLTFLVLGFGAVALIVFLHRRRTSPARWLGYGILAAGFFAILGHHLIWSAFVFGNPLYPLNIVIGPLHIDGPYKDAADYFPPYLKDKPQALRWFYSIIEYRALELRPVTYTNGMGDVPLDSHSARMGGFFGFLAVFSAVFFVTNALRANAARARVLLVAFGVMTAVIPFLPASHETRYYLVWMMFLIVANLAILGEEPLLEAQRIYRLALLCAFIFVASVTGFRFVKLPVDRSPAYIAQARTQLERTVQAGGTYCGNDWLQIAFLLTPMFHQELAQARPYNIRVGDCTGLTSIPRS